MPLIALHAGLRLNEICQLDLDDIRVVEGVNCFWITERSAHGSNDKRIKTASSERLVPIHPTLLDDLDFMAFVDERRRKGGQKVFPELPASASTGYYSDPFSKWFVEKAGAASPKTCFHSFRHNFRDGLREARIDHDVALALGGWANGGGREGVETAENYGGGFRVQTLASALSEVRYPNLDLSHLRLTAHTI